MRTTSFLGLSVLLTVVALGCGDVAFLSPRDCTEIGCANQLDVTFGALGNQFAKSLPLAISVCVDDKGCEGFLLQISGGQLQCLPSGGETLGSCSVAPDGKVTVSPGIGVGGALAAGEHAVAFTIEDGDGMTLLVGDAKVVLKESRPNGPDCPPVCVQGRVTVPS